MIDDTFVLEFTCVCKKTGKEIISYQVVKVVRDEE